MVSFTAHARQSLSGQESVPGQLSPNPTEENSFFATDFAYSDFGMSSVVGIPTLAIVFLMFTLLMHLLLTQTEGGELSMEKMPFGARIIRTVRAFAEQERMTIGR